MKRCLFALCWLLAAAPVLAEQNLLFILDASGSMWGRVQGEPKIVVAREVMADLVEELPDDSRAGLIAYGHNRKGDCGDIETLVSLGPLQREALIERIQALNPKGKTPITDSVRRAVEHLRTLEESASVVLVSDGLESCDGDPCAAVREAREAGVDFRLHVVGFDLGETDTEQLQCMADAAGGRYFSAANADELSEALKEAVAVSPALQLTVTANGERTPARVFVEPAGGGEEVARDRVGAEEARNPRRIELPAGDYDIRVRAEGLAGHPEQLLSGVTIPEEGEVERQVEFSAAQLRLRITANGEPLEARTYVSNAESGEEVDRDRTDSDGEVLYRLEPGTYSAKVRPDGIDAEDRTLKQLTITAGETLERTVDYSSGRAEVTVTANGEPLDARTYIYHADSGEEASRARTDKDGVAGYDIPAGDYRIRIRPDGIDAPDREIEGIVVQAGETTRESVEYAAGRAEVTVTANGEPLDARTYIYHADSGEEASRARTDKDGVAGYDIPTGEYRIRIRPDGIDAPDREIEGVIVQPGETTRESLDYASGRAEVTVTANGEPLDARTYIYHADSGKEASRGRTNDEGVAGYEVPTGEYWILIRPDGIDAPEREIEGVVVKAGETARESVDYSSGRAEVTVTVNGKPLDARTYIYNADSGDRASRGRTNDEGVAGYDIPAGEYRILIRPDGIDAPEREIEGVMVQPGETTRESVDYSSGRAEVTVTVNGEPLDARTYIYHADSGDRASRGRTNDEGVAGYDIPTGEYRILVRPDGIRAPEREVEGVVVKAGETTRETIDYQSGTLSLQVTTNGAPQDARIYVYNADSGDRAARGRTDDEGTASYRIPPGTYRIEVRPDGIDADDRTLEGVTVNAGETTDMTVEFDQ